MDRTSARTARRTSVVRSDRLHSAFLSAPSPFLSIFEYCLASRLDVRWVWVESLNAHHTGSPAGESSNRSSALTVPRTVGERMRGRGGPARTVVLT